MLWKVIISDEASVIFKQKLLSDDDLETIQTWALTISKYGPEKLLEFPHKWADNALTGKWKGFRSSSFSYKGRIIYKIENQIVTITVVRITPDHNYKI